MSIVRDLLGVSGNWGKAEPITSGMILFNNESSLMPFTPVVTKVSNFKMYEERGRGCHFDVVSVFPGCKGQGPRHSTTLYGENVIEVDSKHILDDRKVISVDAFDFSKRDSITEFIKENGALTVVINDPKAASDAIKKVNLLRNGYSCFSFIKHNTGKASPPQPADELELVYSFYDLPMVLPIYKKAKADGFGCHICLRWKLGSKASGHLRYAFEAFFAVNKYPENLLQVDGQNLFQPSPMGKEYIDHIVNLFDCEIKRRNTKGASPKKAVSATSPAAVRVKLKEMTAVPPGPIDRFEDVDDGRRDPMPAGKDMADEAENAFAKFAEEQLKSGFKEFSTVGIKKTRDR